MAYDAFISYSSKDKAVADAIVAAMESNQIRCWYAPRDIKPGGDWGEEIAEAIASSNVFLLIFSKSANRSQRVLDELNLAITRETTILPFRIENLDPKGAMQLHLSARHWLDAFTPSWENYIDKLVRAVRLNLEGSELEEVFEDIEVTASGKGSRKKKKWLIPVAGAAIMIGLGLVYGIPRLTGESSDIDKLTQEAATGLIEEATRTPLPEPTSVPLGSAENPIIWMFAPFPGTNFIEVNSAAEAITKRFTEMNEGLVMKAIPGPSLSGVYDALCNGKAHVGYLDAFTYLRADEEDCDIEARLIWHVYEDIKFGGAIFVSGESKGIQSLSELEGKVLCVPDHKSTSGWVLPSLELRASIGDPNTFFSDVMEMGSHNSVIESLYSGVCEVGTSYYDAREWVNLPNVKEEVEILMTTIPSPNINMSFRTDIDDSLLNLLISFFGTASSEDNNLVLVSGVTSESGVEKMIEINDFYYADLRDLLERAGASPSEFQSTY